ncbi:site-2 protease family protein [Paenibacillus aurantius]|uniref:Site-2 protease family protein n=1 Tax=Paenibacillus aurantius TaxID=2918900 RepID=A0AA96LHB8_9BACL|nr:site-2 protease family protein [Paenibacillus aurantius]WNQ12978.1 site-2 protease family protein [Paenibacillus aurantius]
MINLGGTAYRFHPLFVMLMLLSLATGYFVELLTLFGLVFIHEMGHVAAAKAFGWTVREVQFLPFGGVAVVEESGSMPAREELWVALAGPLQNLWMIALALLMKAAGWDNDGWWDYFLKANAMLGLFNLLPVLPLDGGKVLLSVLSYWVSYHRAMLFCAWSSLAFSCVLLGGTLLTLSTAGLHLNLLMIGVFLLYSNWYGYRHLPYQFIRFLMSREKTAARQRGKGIPAQPLLVHEQAPVGEVARRLMRERHHLIYVCGPEGRIRGVLPERRLIDSYFTDAKTGRAVSELIM